MSASHRAALDAALRTVIADARPTMSDETLKASIDAAVKAVIAGARPAISPKAPRPAMSDEEVRRILRIRFAVPVPIAAQALGISIPACYVAIRNGSLPAKNIGRRVLVLTKPLLQLLGADEVPAA